MEEQNQPLPCPIAGEPASPCRCENFTPRLECLCCGDSLTLVRPKTNDLNALMKHIGYALELIGEVIDEMHHAVDIEDLIKIQHHLVNAKWSVPRIGAPNGTPIVEDEALLDPDNLPFHAAPSIADELEDADLEGWN